MNKREKIKRCQEFFNEVEKLLSKGYVKVGSCNKDISAYLVPKGTEHHISYYGKPRKSFRFSDHWNWYSSKKKCKNLSYIQCHNLDLVPEANMRLGAGKASEPVKRVCVGYTTTGEDYITVFGEKYDRQTGEWVWVETSPEFVAKLVLNKLSVRAD